MRPVRAIAPALLVLALTACGGGGTTTSATSVTSAAPAETASSSTTPAPIATTTATSTSAAPTETTTATPPTTTVTVTPTTTPPAPAPTSTGTGALTQAAAARILVTPDQLPGGPWEAMPVSTQPEPWFPVPGAVSDAPEACRRAVERLGDMSTSAPAVHVSRTFRGKGFVPEQVRTTLQSRPDAAEVPRLLTTIGRECRSMTVGRPGAATQMSASAVPAKTPGAAATAITSTGEGRRLDLVFGGVARGETLSFVVADGPNAKGAVDDILQAQVTRLERSPR